MHTSCPALSPRWGGWRAPGWGWLRAPTWDPARIHARIDIWSTQMDASRACNDVQLHQVESLS
jgi:hypothetical protein